MKTIDITLKVESMETLDGIVTLILKREDVMTKKNIIVSEDSMMGVSGMGTMISQLTQQMQEQMAPQIKMHKPNVWKITLLEDEYQKLLPILGSLIKFTVTIDD